MKLSETTPSDFSSDDVNKVVAPCRSSENSFNISPAADFTGAAAFIRP